ncbi:MAG: glycosyltransferase family 2 protein, partial [Lachnospiraceae bacterium]|nr:glycosyltransferase family 2 protein [Lachnospiraceae bacterium]
MRERITFVVPAYNAEATLVRTIESILHQTDERYKIIIVNDGSTDGTDRICQDYAKSRMDKIAYIKQENRGLGGARNRGMDAVTTAYVSFLDSDDWLMPEYVENINKQLEQHTPQMIMTLPQIYHEGSKAIKDWYDKKLFEQVFGSEGAMINPQEDLRIYQFEMNLCRKVLHMDFLKEIQFRFREKIKWEDVYPHFYLLSKCQHCMGVGSVGFYYRIGGAGQIT